MPCRPLGRFINSLKPGIFSVAQACMKNAGEEIKNLRKLNAVCQ